jgi:hypothetical protein
MSDNLFELAAFYLKHGKTTGKAYYEAKLGHLRLLLFPTGYGFRLVAKEAPKDRNKQAKDDEADEVPF